MKASIAALVSRQDEAHARLVATLKERGAGDHAELVAALYLKERIARLDPAVGQFTLKHGAFLDADVIARAVEAVRE